MKLVIAGSRTINKPSKLAKAIDNILILDPDFINKVEAVISGTATGVDRLGEAWGLAYNKNLILRPADWSKGRGAGHVRNDQMADECDFGIVLWDGQSPGTRGMIKALKKHNKPYFIDVCDPDV